MKKKIKFKERKLQGRTKYRLIYAFKPLDKLYFESSQVPRRLRYVITNSKHYHHYADKTTNATASNNQKEKAKTRLKGIEIDTL